MASTASGKAMVGLMSNLVRVLLVLTPWWLRRRLLMVFFKYDLAPTSHIGIAWIYPRRLVMEPFSRIGHLSICKGLDLMHLGENASIGRLNWITGFPLGDPRHFAGTPNRRPELHVERHAAITHRHLIDCTNCVTVGEHTTVAGFRSQLLSHSIDLSQSRQDAQPIQIGRYCFVGTSAVVLGGACLPDYSVLGAMSLLNKSHKEQHSLYAGVPATRIRELPRDLAYFTRVQGFVE